MGKKDNSTLVYSAGGEALEPSARTLSLSREKGQHRAVLSTGQTILAKRVVITTGLHVLPNMPHIPGLDLDSVEWIHSSSYKSRDQLRDKTVLVLGAGETGMDVAYESILAA